MPNEVKPAVVYLRMSPQLRAGLKAAAELSGCTLNAFAVQVLATAVGDPSRFRSITAPDGSALPDIERDQRGYPLDWRARNAHMSARNGFISESGPESDDTWALVKKHDTEDPGFYVEWQARREARSR